MQETEEAPIIRRDYIGSADAYDIYKGNFDSLIKSKMDDKDYVSPRMHRGIVLEQEVLEQFARKIGPEELLAKVRTDTDLPIQIGVCDHCHAELDGLATYESGTQEVWEVKTSEKKAPTNEAELRSKYPRYYYQVQFQMWTSGVPSSLILWCQVPHIDSDECELNEDGELDIKPIRIKYNVSVVTKFWENCPKFWEAFEKAKQNKADLAAYVDVEEFVRLQKVIEEKTAELAAATKEYELQATNIREQILGAMERNNILKYDSDDITISYIAAHTRDSVDTAKLKKDGLYDQYKKTSKVKANVRIKLKEREENGNETGN